MPFSHHVIPLPGELLNYVRAYYFLFSRVHRKIGLCQDPITRVSTTRSKKISGIERFAPQKTQRKGKQ
jgi:hypothetical protein